MLSGRLFYHMHLYPILVHHKSHFNLRQTNLHHQRKGRSLVKAVVMDQNIGTNNAGMRVILPRLAVLELDDDMLTLPFTISRCYITPNCTDKSVSIASYKPYFVEVCNSHNTFCSVGTLEGVGLCLSINVLQLPQIYYAKRGNVPLAKHYAPPVAIFQLINIHTTMMEKEFAYHAYLEDSYLLLRNKCISL